MEKAVLFTVQFSLVILHIDTNDAGPLDSKRITAILWSTES